MATPTEQQIRDMIQAKDTLKALVEAYFWDRFYADLTWRTPDTFDCGDEDEPEISDSPTGNWIQRPSLDEIAIKPDVITIHCSAPACRRGCCGRDVRTYTFPTSYLWLDQAAILADLKAKHAAEQAARLAQREAEQARETAAQERREREELARLKQKYEP